MLCNGVLDINGVNETVGSLAGDSATMGGMITNSLTTGTATLTLGGDNTSTAFGGVITNNVGSTLNLVKQGTGTQTLGGPNSYSGSTTITAGSITSAADNVIPITSAVTLSPTVGNDSDLNLNGFNNSIASLTFSGGAGATSAENSTVQTGAGTMTMLGGVTYDGTNGQGQATISGKLALGPTGTTSRTFNVGDSTNVAATAPELIVSAVVSSPTGTSLVKSGVGMMELSGANTYTGVTNVSGGTLRVSNSSNLGDNTGAGNTIALSGGGSLLGNGTFSTGSNRTVALGTGGGNLSATGTGSTQMTVNGVISGTTALTVGNTTTGGTGVVILSAENTNSGAVTVQAGQLVVNNAGPATSTTSGTGVGNVTVDSGATLGGTGSIGHATTGDVTVSSGANLNPGSVDSAGASLAGTLTVVGGLTVDGTVNFQANSGPTATGAVDYATRLRSDGAFTSTVPLNAGVNDLISMTELTTAPSFGATSTIKVASTYTSWVLGDVLKLFDWNGAIGSTNAGGSAPTFDFSTAPLLGGLTWDTSRFAETGSIGVAPEPSRVLLMMFSLSMMFFRRRRNS